MTHGTKLMVFSTAVMGAFVAGLDAGLVYNSWPKFAENWIPENMLSRSPAWKNFFENDVTVQFVHRNLAYLTVISVLSTFIVGRRAPIPKRTRLALNVIVATVFGQAALGVFTLINYVPVWLAACHQSGSMALISSVLWLSHELRRLPK
uniref:Cytochrome c oxidase assembly protein COX15 homolog n=2 Tax=Caenorhabditis japonica TaxID=281687 RepID=A0A8R1E166_CAEJA